MVDRKAEAFALELGGAYPSANVTADTLKAYAKAFTDIGLDVADDVSALLRVRSTFPPSVAQIYEASREVRKETKSEWSTWGCLFVDGVACPNCSTVGDPIIHGHLLPPEDVADRLHELGYPAEQGAVSDEERDITAEDAEWQRVKTATLARLRMHGTCLGTDKPPVELDGVLVCPVCRIPIEDVRKAGKA